MSSIKAIGALFDIMAGVVSLLDLTTDLIILITWWNEGRMVFFYISLVILSLAQCSYLIVFYMLHGKKKPCCHSFLSVLCTIPFAPILSFIMYFVSTEDSKLANFIDNYLLCYNCRWEQHSPDRTKSPMQQAIDEKLHKHIGFLMESLIEGIMNILSIYPLLMMYIKIHSIPTIKLKYIQNSDPIHP